MPVRNNQYVSPWRESSYVSKAIQCDIGLQELQDAYREIERMTLAEIARLKQESDWTDVATEYEALIKLKEKQLSLNSNSTDLPSSRPCKKLCTYYQQLGEANLQARKFSEAEDCARRAHGDRKEIFGPNDRRTLESLRLLCKILRNFSDEERLTEAERTYFNYWAQPTRDEYSFECGRELGCLYLERKDFDKAEGQFRDVLKQRKRHGNLQQIIEAATPYLSVLAQQNKPKAKKRVLEDLWTRHSGPIEDLTMQQHAADLASVYQVAEEYSEAEPIYEALWAVQGPKVSAANVSGAVSKSVLEWWFTIGFRYVTTLSCIGTSNSNHQAKSIISRLWDLRSHLPSSIMPEISTISIAELYTGLLLRLQQHAIVDQVAEIALQEFADMVKRDIAANRDPPSKVQTLPMVENHAKALQKLRKLPEAKAKYETLYKSLKQLIDPTKRDTYTDPLRIGRILLDLTVDWGRRIELKADIKKFQQHQESLAT